MRTMLQRMLALVAAVAASLSTSGPVAAQRPDRLTVPAGFAIERIATVPAARELAVAPNGDLFVGTESGAVYVIPTAESVPGAPRVFVRVADPPVASVAIEGQRMYLGGRFGIWELPYAVGERRAAGTPRRIAAVRTSGIARGHTTTSLAVADGHLYASVGSSCNVCDPELDPTRATVQVMRLDGSGMTAKAVHIRNAIALAMNPVTGTLWAGVAGQDELAHGHPYEIFDPVTLHPGVVDYGWPYCYEDHRAVDDHDCSRQTVARVVFPAYETPIGAAFYPLHPTGRYAFPPAYRGGAFVTLHGSWHQPPVPPRVAFVPLAGDVPKTPVDWSNPFAQWREFVGGCQNADGTRNARPTGVAVAPDGSLLVSEDQGGAIYRIRPRSTTGG